MQTIDEQVAEKKAQLDRLRRLARGSAAALAGWYDVELAFLRKAVQKKDAP